MLARTNQCTDFGFNFDGAGARIISNVGVRFKLLPEPVLHQSQKAGCWNVPLDRLFPWAQNRARKYEIFVKRLILRCLRWCTIGMRRTIRILVRLWQGCGLWISPSLLGRLPLMLLQLLLLANRRSAILPIQSVCAIEIGIGLGKSCPDRPLNILALFLALHRRFRDQTTRCRAFAGF